MSLFNGKPIEKKPEPVPELVPANPNPMVRTFGLYPKRNVCKECRHFIRFQPGKNIYFKCELRGVTHGPGTDHRAKWDACAKFERSLS